MGFNFQPKPNDELWGNQREFQCHEASKLFGRKVHYLRPNEITGDAIWGESVSREFLAQNSYEMFATRDEDSHFEGTEDFGGFGYMPVYNDILYIPIKWFNDANFTPIENDLIYYPDEKQMYEVTKVGDKTSDFNGDRINTRQFNIKFYLKLYQVADDDFTNFETTDISEIEGLDSTDLDVLNDQLTADITTVNPVTITPNRPFGDLDD